MVSFCLVKYQMRHEVLTMHGHRAWARVQRGKADPSPAVPPLLASKPSIFGLRVFCCPRVLLGARLEPAAIKRRARPSDRRRSFPLHRLEVAHQAREPLHGPASPNRHTRQACHPLDRWGQPWMDASHGNSYLTGCLTVHRFSRFVKLMNRQRINRRSRLHPRGCCMTVVEPGSA